MMPAYAGWELMLLSPGSALPQISYDTESEPLPATFDEGAGEFALPALSMSSPCAPLSLSPPATLSPAYTVTASSQASYPRQHGWPSPPLGPGDDDVNNGVKREFGSSPAFINGWGPAPPTLCSSTTSMAAAPLPPDVANMQGMTRLCTPLSPPKLGLDCPCPDALQWRMDLNAPSGMAGISAMPPLPDWGSGLEASGVTSADEAPPPPLPLPASVFGPDSGPVPTLTLTPASAHASVSTSTPPPTPPPTVETSGELGEGDKTHEPYAKLLYRAFMSNPGVSMTLQEIYQWFLDYTDKPVKSMNGGWKNSVRHNLSMNAAFQKRERFDSRTFMSANGALSAKCIYEWYLEPWAVREGIQSTTRYRKTGSSKRSQSQKEAYDAWAKSRSAARADSGRKGGCATRARRRRLSRYEREGHGYDRLLLMKQERDDGDDVMNYPPVSMTTTSPTVSPLMMNYVEGWSPRAPAMPCADGLYARDTLDLHATMSTQLPLGPSQPIQPVQPVQSLQPSPDLSYAAHEPFSAYHYHITPLPLSSLPSLPSLPTPPPSMMANMYDARELPGAPYCDFNYREADRHMFVTAVRDTQGASVWLSDGQSV